MITIVTVEDARQYALLTSRHTSPGSAASRYAAAMYFFGRGMIEAETLETYRTCSPIDHEDPRGLLAARGLLAGITVEETTSCAP
jgi:hypothetical protein